MIFFSAGALTRAASLAAERLGLDTQRTAGTRRNRAGTNAPCVAGRSLLALEIIYGYYNIRIVNIGDFS